MTRTTLLGKGCLLAALRSKGDTAENIQRVDAPPKGYAEERKAGKSKRRSREKRAVAGLVDAVEVGHSWLLDMLH